LLTPYKVKSEVNKKLKDCKALLVNLGANRDTATDQCKYLIDIATRFQEIVTSALNSQYSGNDIFGQQPSLRLVTTLVSRNEAFSKSVQEWGNTYRFKEQNVNDSESSIKAPPDADLNTRTHETHDDIKDLVHDNESLTLPLADDILEWLTTVYQDSRGLELGTFNPSLLPLAMKEQSKKWDSIAFGYISDVVTVTHTFVTDLLRFACPDERIRTGLASMLLDELLDRYRRAFAHVDFILRVERLGHPMTLNHYFNDNLEKL
jgi:flagellin-like hook-associated protein FlgL